MARPSNSNQTVPTFPLRHPKYYIEGADLCIIAASADGQRVLFKVHSYFFTRESKAFDRRLHPSPGGVPLGSDSDPVVLDNVTPDEFELFLGVFYNPKYSIYDMNVDQWKVILRLATEWSFDEVQGLAIRELHTKPDLGLVERLALYEKYNVDCRHRIPLYAALCARDTHLTLEESKTLGLATTFLISSTRERLRALPSHEGRSPLPPGMELDDVYRAFEDQVNLRPGATRAFQQEHGLSAPVIEVNPPQPSAGSTRGGGSQGSGGKRQGRTQGG